MNDRDAIQLLLCAVCSQSLSSRAELCANCGDPDPFLIKKAARFHVDIQVAEYELEKYKENWGCYFVPLIILAAAGPMSLLVLIFGKLSGWLAILYLVGPIFAGTAALKSKVKREEYLTRTIFKHRESLISLERAVVEKQVTLDLSLWRRILCDQMVPSRLADLNPRRKIGGLRVSEALDRARRDLRLSEKLTFSHENDASGIRLKWVRIKDAGSVPLVAGFVVNGTDRLLASIIFTIEYQRRTEVDNAESVTRDLQVNVDSHKRKPFELQVGHWRDRERAVIRVASYEFSPSNPATAADA